MNSKDIKKLMAAFLGMLNSNNGIKPIYIVKYKEVFHKPDSKITTNYTYNLFSFEDLNLAKEYMDCACKCMVNPNIESGNFKVMFETMNDYTDKENNNILYERITKLIGDNDRHKCQTILYIFTVEEINFKQKS